MSDHVQIGPEVDRDVWNQFRERVAERHGTVRGNLGTELENAIQFYEQFGPDGSLPGQLAEMQTQLDRIERATGAVPADGGTHTFHTEYTHTRDSAHPDEKPAPNTPTEKKVRWLAECVRDEVAPTSREFGQVPRSTLRDVVKEEYGFKSETAQRYVSNLVSHFDLVNHPTNDAILVTHEERERLVEELEVTA